MIFEIQNNCQWCIIFFLRFVFSLQKVRRLREILKTNSQNQSRKQRNNWNCVKMMTFEIQNNCRRLNGFFCCLSLFCNKKYSKRKKREWVGKISLSGLKPQQPWIGISIVLCRDNDRLSSIDHHRSIIIRWRGGASLRRLPHRVPREFWAVNELEVSIIGPPSTPRLLEWNQYLQWIPEHEPEFESEPNGDGTATLTESIPRPKPDLEPLLEPKI